MNMAYLNARCKEILQMLFDSDTYISLQQIAKVLKVSRRSIYYDLCRINEWLDEKGIPELEVVRGKGLLLDAPTKEQIRNCVEDTSNEDAYVLSPMERVRIIICSIIYSRTPVYIDKLTTYCRVSRNTIFNDLRVVVNQLQDYDLNLEYESKKGYSISGDAIKIRAVFLLNFHELQSIFTNGGLKFIEKEKIEHNIQLLKKIEKELHIEYIPGNLESLAVLLPLMERGDETLYFANLKKQELENTKEYQLTQKYFPKLIEKEKIYLCLHLLGARVINTSDDIFENCTNQTVYEITKALVSEFEKVACVVFDDREELERELFVHINSSMYRYQYGIQYLDTMNNDIIREYPDLFEITRIVSKYLERQIGLPIPDAEVAYLALHFGAYVPVPKAQNEKLRILIVCANGVSTGNMIKRELKKMLPEAEVIGVKSVSNVQNVQRICDLIVSTVKIKSVVPVIQVHPILTDEDRAVILRHLKLKNNSDLVNVNEIFAIVKPYILKENHEKVKQKIEDYLHYGHIEHYPEEKKRNKGLLDVLSVSKIGIYGDEYKWTQALWIAGESLLTAESIQPEYIESIISQLRYYGPYMFIAPRVILAHAKIENGVNKLDCSLHIFKTPVEFSENDKANVVILLAAEDQESHLKILSDIVTVFSEESKVDEILQLKEAVDIRGYLEQQLTQQETAD